MSERDLWIEAAEDPTKIYRGLNVKFPPELQDHIHRHMALPMQPEEVGQHFKIGPAILDHLEKAYKDYRGKAGLGPHWTTNPRFAEIAAMQGNRGGTPVMLSADWDGNNEDLGGLPGTSNRDLDSRQERFGGEDERTLWPGARVNVHSVKIPQGGGYPDFEVLHDPQQGADQERDYGTRYIGGPQIRLAMDWHSPPSNLGEKPGDEPFRLKDKVPSDYDWLEPYSDEPEHKGLDPEDTPQEMSGKWYHSSPYDYEPGERIEPSGRRPSGAHPDWYGWNTQNRRNYVWMSPNFNDAWGWSNWTGNGSHIYEVHPGDRPQLWNQDKYQGWVAPHATVKRVVQ